MIPFENKLILFGGIIEITKESDEVFTFDPSTSEWKLIDTIGSHVLNNDLNQSSGNINFMNETQGSDGGLS